MQSMPYFRDHRPSLALAALLNAAALALLCGVLAYWTWAWLAPGGIAAAPEPAPFTRLDAARNLFGVSAEKTASAVAAEKSVRLTGVVAVAGDGRAVLQVNGGPALTVSEGAEFMPGMRLLQVLPGAIVIEHQGRRETIALPEKK